MNTRHFIIALAFAASSSAALAQTISPAPLQGKTSAQVADELKQAQSKGLMDHGDADYPVLRPFASSKTAAQVASELQQDQAQGQFKVGDAAYPAVPFRSGKSSAQVDAEMREFPTNANLAKLYQGA